MVNGCVYTCACVHVCVYVCVCYMEPVFYLPCLVTTCLVAGHVIGANVSQPHTCELNSGISVIDVACLIREMWFVDCSCIYIYHMSSARVCSPCTHTIYVCFNNTCTPKVPFGILRFRVVLLLVVNMNTQLITSRRAPETTATQEDNLWCRKERERARRAIKTAEQRITIKAEREGDRALYSDCRCIVSYHIVQSNTIDAPTTRSALRVADNR